ncbi:INO80 complex subunit D-like [Hordeum vulgare]|nr:INO80 complex subunit D-like [Hordeum vulgare]
MTSSYRPTATTSPEAPAPVPKVEAEPPAAVARNPSSPSGPPSPEMEATAEALTREEVLRRRRRRTARLVGVYRRLYWAMAEEVRARHRQYVWELGRSPLEAEQPLSAACSEAKPGPAAVPRRKKCGFTGCKVRAMPMAKYCHSHILSDPNQALYKGCGQIIKRPILKASVPSLCNVHLQRSQKNISQAYKKVGFNPPPTGQISPDFSVLVAECVHQIQARRRESRSAAAGKKCPKDGKVG